jgi:hypothetical protein
MTWYKGFPECSIKSGGQLCEDFASHFTAQKGQQKILTSHCAVVQGKNKFLLDYIKRFISEVVEVNGVDDWSKCFIF